MINVSILAMIALWCGQQTDSFWKPQDRRTITQVNECRVRMVECIKHADDKPESYSEHLTACVTKEKL